MLLTIPAVLDSDQVAAARAGLEGAAWVDGRATAGVQSALAKRNEQLPQDSPLGVELGRLIVAALNHHPLFLAAALPKAVFPPLFNRYSAEAGHAFGNHVDNAIRILPDGSGRIRTDLSATLFLSEPDSYEGGELIVEDTYGLHRVKLPAGDLILYPASSVHRVEPVTRGTRLAAFFWIESLVRDDGERTLLLDLDLGLRRLAEQCGDDDPAIVSLTGVYQNLLRRWAES
jgi:PKHD-type hydroxylase